MRKAVVTVAVTVVVDLDAFAEEYHFTPQQAREYAPTDVRDATEQLNGLRSHFPEIWREVRVSEPTLTEVSE